ncbi:GIY-YIG nuclease family protein [Oceanisphaera avium]|uniref:Endonuclease n=1 Tax=Oceanisphaera avium TaxID=1903694 RepID=A0A1Y0CXE0_9GAMM|nr:GIY-YIG nuclease family protein [Oceanisphaera avium]ART79972.1 endonuclease [Oceanisphaera avium]
MATSSFNTAKPTWYLYLVRCVDGSLYAGISLDPQRRCHEHNQQRSRASRYVWARRPAQLVWNKPVASHSEALKLEIKLKRLSKAQKEQLIIEDKVWTTFYAPLKTAP